jgi:kynureninase
VSFIADLDHAHALDQADPLAGYRQRFLGADLPLIYFDGNSLGRPLAITAQRLTDFVHFEWGGRLIRGWDESWFDLPIELGDRLGAAALGAAPGQTMIGDSTTVLLYKLTRAAVDAQLAADPERTEIVVDSDNFPTDRYVAEAVANERGLTLRWIDVDRMRGVTPELLTSAVGPRTALVLLSHVAYRSGFLADGAALTGVAHDAGALILWDLSHSVGSVPVALDAWGADLAVGCCYKYLNGGPGAPALAYVAARHQERLVQPVRGWIGHADPFAMGPDFEPAAGIRRFQSGTPPIVGMIALGAMVDLIEEVGLGAIRAKSVALTTYALDLAHEWLVPQGACVATPEDPSARGGHVTINHPRMQAVTAALWERDVIPDYRDPGGLRIGLSPLSTSFAEVWHGLAAIREELGHH